MMKRINEFLNECPAEGASETEQLAHAIGWAVRLMVWVFLISCGVVFVLICLIAGLTAGRN